MGVSLVSCGWLYTSQPTSVNKIIFTNDRLYTSRESWKLRQETRPIIALLASATTFYHNLQKTYNFARSSSHYSIKWLKNNVEFIPCLDFELIKQLQNCLLVFHHSCEENYQGKEFFEIAFAGRHEKVHCIFVKHIFCHQSILSRTIDRKTTHVVLFKSPHDVQHIDHFGRHLSKSQCSKS